MRGLVGSSELEAMSWPIFQNGRKKGGKEKEEEGDDERRNEQEEGVVGGQRTA